MSAENSQVVVGFDFSHSGKSALYRAIALATRAPWHVLHFVCVVDPHSPFPALPAKKVDLAYAERVQEAITGEITQELKAKKIEGRIHFFVHAPIGKPAHEILLCAEMVGADLILVGSKGLTGIERAVLGSVSERIVREAGCTVEVVRPKTYAYVPLLEIVDNKQAVHKYAAPHRYTYENHVAERRPADWPLY
jgi:nucleotide-binding universal stress UspA family protein